jgi:hypothetical protein
MTRLLGWIILTLAFASFSLALLYPGYRIARRAYPGSRQIRWLYAVAAAVCGVALWLLLPLIVQKFFGRPP